MREELDEIGRELVCIGEIEPDPSFGIRPEERLERHGLCEILAHGDIRAHIGVHHRIVLRGLGRIAHDDGLSQSFFHFNGFRHGGGCDHVCGCIGRRLEHHSSGTGPARHDSIICSVHSCGGADADGWPGRATHQYAAPAVGHDAFAGFVKYGGDALYAGLCGDFEGICGSRGSLVQEPGECQGQFKSLRTPVELTGE